MSEHSSFPVVGIGASAGGLDAFTRLISSVPAHLNAAWIFIQHQPPHHRSLLPDLIHNKRSEIELVEIRDKMQVQPGTFYFSPPGMDLEVEENLFRVVEPPPEIPHLPIDRFFSSLGRNYGERAIGVILSGAGTDGSRGCQEIRTNGGTVLVQDPSTAQFAGMPESAIATAFIDQVLPPENIASELHKIITSYDISSRVDGLTESEQFDAFFELMHARTGYRFNYYKRTVITRRLLRRTYLHGLGSIKEYLDLLAHNDQEAQRLAADFMIGVTSFFRDRHPWEQLRKQVIKPLVERRSSPPLRIWTPACATGEEAYSIAMLVQHELDMYDNRRELQVFATDISEGALERAREGTYLASTMADIPPEYIRSYFTCHEECQSYIVNKRLRERVVFAKHDVLQDPPFSKLDLIICRNLLIYLEPDAQEKCIDIFYYSLMEGGHLFLGSAETVGKRTDLFKPLEAKTTHIYQRLGTRKLPRLTIEMPMVSEVPRQTLLHPTVTSGESEFSAIQESILERYAPAALAINSSFQIVYLSGPVERYLKFPRGPLSHNLFDLMPQSFRTRLRSALFKVQQEVTTVTLRAGLTKLEGKKGLVTVSLSRVRKRNDLFLVVFEEKATPRALAAIETADSEQVSVEDAAVRQLENELSATREELQKHIEQLKSMNEEMQSSNEELQASNEELETSREELQSLNEELITVNNQLQAKIEEQEETNNDLTNFLSSTNIPTLFLDQQFRVRRFTPAMTRLVKLIPSDIGRPLSDLSQEYLGPDLLENAHQVLRDLSPVRKEIHINDSWYIRSSLPYRTLDNRIQGVVIAYVEITDLKRAQKEAEEGQRTLEALMTYIPQGITIADAPDVNIRMVSKHGQQLTGRSVEEITGIPAEKHSQVWGVYHLDGSTMVDPNDLPLTRAAKKGEIAHGEEFILKRPDGSQIYIATDAGPIRDKRGSITGAVIGWHDITERKRLEHEMVLQREFLDQIITHARAGIAVLTGRELRYTFVNPAYQAFCPKIPMLGKTYRDVFPEAADGGAEAKILNVLETGEPWNLQRYRAPISGKADAVWEGQIVQLSTSRNGEEPSVLVLVWDVTDQSKQEMQIAALNQQLRGMFDHAPAGLVLFDAKPPYRVLVNNRIYQEFYGEPFRSHGMEGLALTQFVSTAEADGVVAFFDEVVATKTAKTIYDFEYHGMERGTTWWDWHLSPVIENGEVVYLVNMAIEVTEQFLAARDLKASEERFHAAVDNYPSAFVIYDSERRIQFLNRAGYATSKMIAEQVLGRRDEELFSDEVCRTYVPHLLATYEQKKPHHCEITFTLHGTTYTQLVDYVPLLDSSGNIRQVLGITVDMTERKRMEREIRRSEEISRLRLKEIEEIYRNVPDGLCVLDLDLRFIRINERLAEINGLPAADHVGRTIDEVVPTLAEQVRSICRQILQTGRPVLDIEIVGTTASQPGVTRTWLEDWMPLKNDMGEIIGLSVVVEEITERKRTQESLQKSVTRFMLLADTAEQLLHSSDPQSLIEMLCRKVMEQLDCQAFFNFLVDEGAGRLHLNAYAGIPEEEAQKIEWLDIGVAVCGCVAQEGRRIVAECIPSSQDERTKLVKSYGIRAYACHPLLAENGKVIGTISFGTKSRDQFSEDDLSLMKAVADQVAVAMNRMRSEKTLRESSERLRSERELLQAIYDSIPVMLSVYDPAIRRVYLNKAFERITGWTAEDTQAANVMELVYPDPQYREEVRAYMDSLAPGFKDIRMTSKNGAIIESSWANTQLADGRRVGIGIDITDRKRLESSLLQARTLAEKRAEELSDANRELESFSYSVAHDLRSPLRSLMGFSDFLLEDYAEKLDAEGKAFIEKIKNAGQKMNDLIDDMLMLAKVSRQDMVFEEVDMSTAARQFMAELRSSDPSRRIDISIQDGMSIRGDKRLLQLALTNLLRNAWKYSGKKPESRVEFGCFEKENRTIYFIRDNGAGFEMARAEKLFVPFQRLHAEKDFPGTGIGLAIVERVLRRHGGRIWAEAKVNEGATFYFCFDKIQTVKK